MTVLVMVVLQGLGVFGLLVQLNAVLGDLVASDKGAASSGLPRQVILFIAANTTIVVAAIVVNNRRMVLGELVTNHVRHEILGVAAIAELDDFDDSGFYDRLGRATQSSTTRPMLLVSSMLEIVQAVFMLIGATTALVIVEPWIAMLAGLAVLPLWLGGVRGGQRLFEFVVETTPGDRRRDYLFDLLTTREPAVEVRAFDLGTHLATRWRALTDQRMAALLATTRKRFRASVWASIGSNAVLVGVATLLIFLHQAEVMTLAETATAAGALLLLSQKLMDGVQSTNDFFDAALLMSDLDDFLALAPELRQDRPTTPAPSEFAEIVVEDVSFTYKGSSTPALADVSLAIRRGEVVALVGENGSGKTTLTKVLAGLYPADSGRILVDDEDLADLDPVSWRTSIAVVFQNFARFAFTAAENIQVGAVSREPSEDDLRTAASAAGADEFLRRLPRAYDTMLSPEFDNGQDLSLGQWQRVALARAFYRSAPLVILDEPTASLDARMEKMLFDTVRDLYAGRTVLLISHRFSTVRTADRIVVLSGGRVVEQGTHDELVEADGLYAELFALQASSYLEVPVPLGDGATAPEGAVAN